MCQCACFHSVFTKVLHSRVFILNQEVVKLAVMSCLGLVLLDTVNHCVSAQPVLNLALNKELVKYAYLFSVPGHQGGTLLLDFREVEFVLF